MLFLLLMAQNIDPPPPVRPPGYADVRTMQVPVIAGDITDRPYRVVGEIKTSVRKWTIFEKDPSQAKVYNELWERARKLGADAVVNARYGETLYGGLTWGRRHATGQAIKFLSEAVDRRAPVASVGNAPGATMSANPADAPGTIDLGGGVVLVPSQTLSGYCIRASGSYVGTGSVNRPTVTAAKPRCN